MIVLSDNNKKKILNMIKSGNYYLWLFEWTPTKGQDLVLFPTNKGLKNGVKFEPKYYPVRHPNPMKGIKIDKRSGSAYKSGRFLVINNSVKKVLIM